MKINDKSNRLQPIQYGKATLKSQERLRLKSEFNDVRENGIKFAGRYLVLVVSNATDGKSKYAIACSKKFSKKAVTRNRARRLIRESFRLIKAQIDTAHILFIPKIMIQGQHLQQVQLEMIELFKQAKIWKKEIKK